MVYAIFTFINQYMERKNEANDQNYCIKSVPLERKKVKRFIMKIFNIVHARFQTEPTAFLGGLGAHFAQSAPRKTIDLDHLFFLKPLILEQAYWYQNESSLHEELEYVIISLIQGNLDIVGSGTQMVKERTNLF